MTADPGYDDHEPYDLSMIWVFKCMSCISIQNTPKERLKLVTSMNPPDRLFTQREAHQ